MDRGTGRAIIHGVTKSQKQLNYPEMASPGILPIRQSPKHSGFRIPLSMPHLELGPTYRETSYIALSPLPATSMGPTSRIQAFILSLLVHGHQPPHHLPAALHLFHPPLGRETGPQGAELGPCHSPAQQPSVTHYCLCHLPLLDDHQCSKFHHCLVA